MRIWKLAVFTTSLPDDWIMEEDDVVQFPGEAASNAIVLGLRAAGLTVSTPTHLSEQGWDFFVGQGAFEVWMKIASMDEGVFELQHAPRARVATFDNPAHAHILEAFADVLRRDERFGVALWLDKVGEAYGFTEPVVGAPDSEKLETPVAWRELS